LSDDAVLCDLQLVITSIAKLSENRATLYVAYRFKLSEIVTSNG